jgi:hypothetical protein
VKKSDIIRAAKSTLSDMGLMFGSKKQALEFERSFIKMTLKYYEKKYDPKPNRQ